MEHVNVDERLLKHVVSNSNNGITTLVLDHGKHVESGTDMAEMVVECLHVSPRFRLIVLLRTAIPLLV